MACMQCNHFDGTRCWKHRFSVCCPDKFECPEIAEKDGGKVITELIKPCPFCGGETIETYTETVDAETEVYHFRCRNCYSDTYFDYSDEKQSIIDWNNRTNKFDSDKYEELVLTEMERKHSENQQLLSELKAMLPTTTEAEIRAKAIDEVFEFLKSKRGKRYMNVNLDDLEIRKYKEQLKEG